MPIKDNSHTLFRCSHVGALKVMYVVAPSLILTAAHCTHNADWVQIFYGTTKQIHSKTNCWNFVRELSDTNICVGPNVRPGDSGGPLVTRDDSKLVGVASFIDSNLSGFTRVSAYLDWIRSHTRLE
ncbi:serine protease 1-like isoform X2 [Drosophila nasuta]|uniref:serine protease 1-like isoform X2 n=1 Tax=Drosophila nasuta TaxID=42062 RepID=UPI00295EA566|nr:serine protease 1-like isoform X2 [Drosophila nasuta]